VLLRRLELLGFKSFADKTTVEFGAGISAIVGPNGSGKSNITDAVRWVLGEGSARTLRGHRMEDVIFGGSPRRRPVPLAEVTLTLDNADATLPLPHAEVSVTRRVDRSGVGEYFINREACRLRDVQDLFAGTGLGRNAYAIVGQGQVDEVLRAPPLERRALVEEAAGVTRYRQRLYDGNRRLAAAAVCEERISDLVAERQRALGALSRQAERAERHQRLSSELRALDLQIWARDWAALTRDHAAAAAEVEAASTAYDALSDQLAGVAGQQRDLGTALGGARAEQDAAAAASLAAERAVDRARQAGSLAAGLAAAAEAEAQRAERRCNDLLAARERDEAEGRAAASAAVAAQEQLAACRGRAEAADAALAGTVQERRAAAAAVGRVQRDLAACRQELAAASGGDAVALEAARAALRAAEERVAVAAAAAVEASAAAAECRGRVRAAETDAAAARRRVTEVRAHRDALAAFVGGLRGRIRVLAQVAASGAGYAQGPRTALAGKARGLPAFTGVIGALGELMEVPSRLSAAIAAALGGAVQDIVTESADAAQRAIEGLKAAQGGRATFLPLGALSVSPVAAELRGLAARPGALGWAADLVSCTERVRPAVLHTLGRVLVAEDLTAARRLGQQSGYRVRCVTLEGDVVHPGGAMSGGVIRGERAGGLLGRDQEQRHLQDRVGMLAADQERLDAALAALLGSQERLDQSLSEARRAAAGADARAQGALQQERAGKSDRERSAQQAAALAERLGARAQTDPVELGRRERALAAEGDEASLRLAAAEVEETRCREAATAARIAMATAEAQAASARVDAARHQRESEETGARLREAEADRGRALATLDQQRRAGADALGQAAAAAEGLTAAAARLYAAREAVVGLQQQAARAAARREAAERDRERLAADLRRAEAALAKSDTARAALAARLETAYGLTTDDLRQAAPSERPAADRERAAALRRELGELGGVRPEAVTEYREEAEALATFSGDAEDVRQAALDLIAWGREMEGALGERYEETLAAVRRHFAAIYARLSGGGAADLIPVAPPAPEGAAAGESATEARPDAAAQGRPATGGLEIVAQPTGKQLAHLGLLSGGERTLVAIALVLAFLQVRPTAFCILDEIEAALDDANVGRCAAYLTEVARGTQFIVVTHQKGTMEAADRLVGVTMGEAGVSSLLSVRLAG